MRTKTVEAKLKESISKGFYLICIGIIFIFLAAIYVADDNSVKLNAAFLLMALLLLFAGYVRVMHGIRYMLRDFEGRLGSKLSGSPPAQTEYASTGGEKGSELNEPDEGPKRRSLWSSLGLKLALLFHKRNTSQEFGEIIEEFKPGLQLQDSTKIRKETNRMPTQPSAAASGKKEVPFHLRSVASGREADEEVCEASTGEPAAPDSSLAPTTGTPLSKSTRETARFVQADVVSPGKDMKKAIPRSEADTVFDGHTAPEKRIAQQRDANVPSGLQKSAAAFTPLSTHPPQPRAPWGTPRPTLTEIVTVDQILHIFVKKLKKLV